MSFSRWRDTGLRLAFGEHSIFYQRHGEGATALLLIHGFPTASWDWEPLWPDLCKHFDHVVAPDLLGFGFSDKPTGHRYSLLEQADLCETLLASLAVERVHILAHNYGVSVAQELLARFNEREAASAGQARPQLVSVALLNGGLFPEAHHPRLTQRLLKSPLGPLIARLTTERRFGKTFSKIFGRQTRPSAIELHDFWTLIATNSGQRVMPRLIRYLDERREHRERWVAALTETKVPLRLINGPEDPVSGADMVRRYEALVPNPDVVALPGIGHYPQIEAADRTLRAFLEFHRKRVQQG